MPVRTEWHGAQISQQVMAAAVAGVNETTAAAVPQAQGRVHVDSGLLQSRITSQPAVERGGQVVGAFGVFDDPGYGWLQEILPEPRGKAYIRPAGDEQAQQLPTRIRSHLQ